MRIPFAALIVAATFAGAIALPGAAHAEPTLQVLGAQGDPLHAGQIQVFVDTDTEIASIVVHVLKNPTMEQVIDVTDFHRSGLSSWESGPVTLPDYQIYSLDTEVTDVDGNRSELMAGTMFYFADLYFDQLKYTKTVTYNHRDLVVSGRLMARWPEDDALKPAGDVPLALYTRDGDPLKATADADGFFSFTSEVKSATDTAELYTQQRSPVPYQGASASIPAPVIKKAPARLTLAVAPRNPVVASGVETWKSPAKGWIPLAGGQITAALCPARDDASCTSLGSTVTDAAGHYSVPTTPEQSGKLRITATAGDPFIADAVRTKPVTVR